jgi:hypothetical protein
VAAIGEGGGERQDEVGRCRTSPLRSSGALMGNNGDRAVVRRPAGGNQSHRVADSDVCRRYPGEGCWTMRPKMMIAVLQLAKGCRVCARAQAQGTWPESWEYRGKVLAIPQGPWES